MQGILDELKTIIFGKHKRGMIVPSIGYLQYVKTKGMKNWKVKKITHREKYKLLSNSWFLVNSHYPNSKILKKGEIGANVYSKTRYILTPYATQT